MPTDLNDLLNQISEDRSLMTPLSRLRFLRRVATEEELAGFFRGLLVKAMEAKHQDRWEDLVQFLEAWEDRTLSRLAATSPFPDTREVPWTPLTRPLSETRFALLTSGGLYVDGQTPFVTSNDPTYRELPKDTPQEHIRASHRGYDVRGPLQDVDCLLPLHRFQELEREGTIGGLAETSYSFNGSIEDVSLLQEWPRQVARKMKEEGVEAVFIAPA
ncbi:MAG: hypothetical protein HYY01_09210 [Chloroflexi bacterium]|nr:hypothetical protein [Chloroflexota bacterium]